MVQLSRAAASFSMIAAALLVTACGQGGDSAAANNSAALPTPSTNAFTIGNDASAVEMVGSGKALGTDPMLTTGNMAAPPDDDASMTNGAAPADGGSQAEGNVAGM